MSNKPPVDSFELVKKRTLVPAPVSVRSAEPGQPLIAAYSRLVTTDSSGRRALPILAGMRPVKIGRHTSCDYVVESDKVSLFHCQVYLVRNPLARDQKSGCAEHVRDTD